MKVKSLSPVWLCDPVDCSPPGSSIHGILQASILEWVAISFSRGPFQPRDQTQVSDIAGRCFNLWASLSRASFKNRKQGNLVQDKGTKRKGICYRALNILWKENFWEVFSAVGFMKIGIQLLFPLFYILYTPIWACIVLTCLKPLLKSIIQLVSLVHGEWEIRHKKLSITYRMDQSRRAEGQREEKRSKCRQQSKEKTLKAIYGFNAVSIRIPMAYFLWK